MSTPQERKQSAVIHLEQALHGGLRFVPLGPTSEKSTEAFLPKDSQKFLTLEALKGTVSGCLACKLCQTRTHTVFGEGNPQANLMFIGEGPGADEDREGRPFIGRAGKLLTKIIESMGLTREKVFIANVVKCRPPENRNPEPDEILACAPFLAEQIRLVAPKVIICLGTFASQTVLKTAVPISKIRGTFVEQNGIKIMPTFHPAYLLRNPAMKRIMWEDCKTVMLELGLKSVE